MVFIFSHYPQYSANPLDIQNWLYGEAIRLENEEAQRKAMEEAYSQPSRSKYNNNYGDYYDEEDYGQESNFGIGATAKANKKGKA